MLTVFVLFNFSCKKKSSAPSCKVISMSSPTSSGTTLYQMAYDNNGKIAALTSSGGGSSPSGYVYAYSGNLVVWSSTTSTSDIDSITVNSNGYMVTDINWSAGNRTVTNYTYDGNGDIKQSVAQQGSNAPVTTRYTYSGGDLTSIIFPGADTTYFAYNTNRAAQPGDYLHLLELTQYGAPVFKTVHEVQRITNPGSTPMNLDYSYDSKGNILTVTAIQGTSVSSLSLEYDCDVN